MAPAGPPMRLAGVMVLLQLAASAASACVDPRSLGAVAGSDQRNYAANTPALQKALDMASAASGGASHCVNVTGGDYVTGDLLVGSNTLLHLHRDARLVVAVNHSTSALVGISNAVNVTLTGGGTLFGFAEATIAFYSAVDDRFQPWDGPRPHLLHLNNATNVTVTDVHFRNSSNWNLRLDNSQHVLVDGVTVYGSHQYPNNDGIDPESSRFVTIRNSAVDVADDGVCPKASASMGPLHDLLVSNCTIRSKSHAIKFGSNTDTDMYNIVFDNVTIWDSNGGLSIQQRSGGDIYNVTWSNIQVETRYEAPRWWGNGEWATITAQPRHVNDSIGRTHNLTFVNISAVSENGGLFSGVTHGLQDLVFDNVYVSIQAWSNYSTGSGPPCRDVHGGASMKCMGSWDHRPSDDEDDCSYYCRSPGVADGFRLENVQGAVLRNVGVHFATPRLPWFGQCVSHDSRTSGVRAVGMTCVNNATAQPVL